MNRHMILGAVCFGLASLVGLYSDAWADDTGHIEMQQHTPQSVYLPVLNTERDNPDSFIWSYIAGVVSGANLGAVLQTGRPIACQMHSMADTQATANLLLEYLLATDMVGDDRASLEIAAIGAFVWAYPCGVEL
jgi:hypothetical protein